MAKIAIFFHARISGGAHEDTECFKGNSAIIAEHGEKVLAEQIGVIRNSGLLEASSHFFVGLNGDAHDYKTVVKHSPEAEIIMHPKGSASELPTMGAIERWVKSNPGYLVLYLHTKGVCWPGNPFRAAWRKCLMTHTVKNWEQCVTELVTGYDMVGPHWLTAHKYPHASAALPHGIFGGNFFWTTSNYLRRLKPLQTDHSWKERYQAEMWPTSGNPKVRGLADHWPDIKDCSRA
jgi:hypothetical protein